MLFSYTYSFNDIYLTIVGPSLSLAPKCRPYYYVMNKKFQLLGQIPYQSTAIKALSE